MINIYTDGSCCKNPGPGGWALLVVEKDKPSIQISGKLIDTTNNQMELEAAFQALKWLSENAPTSKATIYTDSNYVKQGITEWIYSWKKRGWRTANNDPVKNLEYWKKIDLLNQQLIVQWQWIKAHNGHPENEIVDKLARSEAESLLNGGDL